MPVLVTSPRAKADMVRSHNRRYSPDDIAVLFSMKYLPPTNYVGGIFILEGIYEKQQVVFTHSIGTS